jgi:hypothetical protein
MYSSKSVPSAMVPSKMDNLPLKRFVETEKTLCGSAVMDSMVPLHPSPQLSRMVIRYRTWLGSSHGTTWTVDGAKVVGVGVSAAIIEARGAGVGSNEGCCCGPSSGDGISCVESKGNVPRYGSWSAAA